MKKCTVAGDWVLENVVCIQRYTYQILHEIDVILTERDSDLQFELIIPKMQTGKIKLRIVVKKRYD